MKMLLNLSKSFTYYLTIGIQYNVKISIILQNIQKLSVRKLAFCAPKFKMDQLGYRCRGTNDVKHTCAVTSVVILLTFSYDCCM